MDLTPATLDELDPYLTPRERAEVDALLSAGEPDLDFTASLFAKQRAFVTDRAKWKTAVCSRRAGKTVGAAAALLDSALKHPDSVNLYITRSRKNAKQIIWGTLKSLNRQHRLGGEPNESDLSITFGNGARIYLAGANDRDAIEDFRGHGMALAVVDEAQSLPAYLQDLVDAVLVPALMDYDGTLILIGTPGPVPVGYFYDASQSKAWSHHDWTVYDNPFIEQKSGRTPQQHLEAELARRGLTTTDPVIQREWFGRWVHDPDSLVFRFEKGRNTFTTLPNVGTRWEHVIGIDLGFTDADAISVLAFTEGDPNAYQVHEWVGSKQSISELADRLRPLIDRYQPINVVWDTGGLGLKIADEVTRRTGIALKAADKMRKLEFIELLNDALRTGRVKVRPDSRFATDAMLVEWDKMKATPDKRVISDRYHSDVADSLLYAFRESLHWLHEPPASKPTPGTPAWSRQQEEELEQQDEEAYRREQEELGWGEWA